MTVAGKILMIVGAVLLAVGAGLWSLGRMGFRGFPEDIRMEGEHTRFYFPWVTCLLLSFLATALVALWNWMTRR